MGARTGAVNSSLDSRVTRVRRRPRGRVGLPVRDHRERSQVRIRGTMSVMRGKRFKEVENLSIYQQSVMATARVPLDVVERSRPVRSGVNVSTVEALGLAAGGGESPARPSRIAMTVPRGVASRKVLEGQFTFG